MIQGDEFTEYRKARNRLLLHAGHSKITKEERASLTDWLLSERRTVGQIEEEDQVVRNKIAYRSLPEPVRAVPITANTPSKAA